MTRITLSLAAVMASTSPVLADPGAHHFSLVQSLVHVLTEPDHLAMAAVAVLGVWWLVRRRKTA